MNWGSLAIGLGIGFMAGIITMALYAIAGHCTQSERINALRVALGDLIRAVEFDGPDPFARAAKNAHALRNARKVLEQ